MRSLEEALGYIEALPARVAAPADPSFGISALGRSGQSGLSALHDNLVASEAAGSSQSG